MVKEYVMLNKEKVLSALYQLNTEVSKQDLAELLGIDHRNLTRYWKESVQLKYIKTWKVQTGRTSYVMLQITPLGIKEAKKLPKQVDLKDVVISEPEIEPEIEITPEMKVKGKAKLKAKKEAKKPKEVDEFPKLPASKEEIKKLEKIKKSLEAKITPEIEIVPISIEKKKLKFELMTYCSKLPIRMVDCKLFGFKGSAFMRARIMEIISEL